jgi:hypothetical protein
MLHYAINTIHDSDDAANFYGFEQQDTISMFDLLLNFESDIDIRQARMDQKRSAVIRAPGAILDIFVPANHQPSPRLAQG